jgi:hypothetical protein
MRKTSLETLNSLTTKWHFSGTVKRRVSGKVRSEKLDIASSAEFAKLASTCTNVCPYININDILIKGKLNQKKMSLMVSGSKASSQINFKIFIEILYCK